MSFIVLGSQGQLGRALMSVCDQFHVEAFSLSREEVDLAFPEKLVSSLEAAIHRLGVQPTVLINSAAYTQVDRAETGEEEQKFAYPINAASPGVLAEWCAKRGIPFVHYSTDYVFSGTGDSPWTEDSLVSPINAYGRTKLAGEKAVAEAGGKYLIFRTSWVYDAHGKNFLRTMLRLGAEREELRVVDDQRGAPTFATHLAAATFQALQAAMSAPVFPAGIYHLCNRGEASWREFAVAIFESARKKGVPLRVRQVIGIQSQDYPTPAQRPLNSRLDTQKAEVVLGTCLPHWKAGLEECLEDWTRSQQP